MNDIHKYALERSHEITDRIVQLIVENAHDNGCLDPLQLANVCCYGSINGGDDDDDDYNSFAQNEVNCISQVVLPQVLLHAAVDPLSQAPLTLYNIFGAHDTEQNMSLYYAICLKECTLQMCSGSVNAVTEAAAATDRVATELFRTVQMNRSLYLYLELLMDVLRATAASVMARALHMRYASARNTMRTVFSMCKTILFRDCPRGVAFCHSVVNAKDPKRLANLLLANPPFTRAHVNDSDTDVDAIATARNAWLSSAWSLFVSMTHGSEKEKDLYMNARVTKLHLSDAESQQLHSRTVRSHVVANLAAHLVSETLMRFDDINDIANAQQQQQQQQHKKNHKQRAQYLNDIEAIKANISDAGAMHLALFAYFAYEAIRNVERADRLFIPASTATSSTADAAVMSWSMPDFELLPWLWPMWRGGLDRPRGTKFNALSTKPTSAVYREDARHIHQFRNTRSTLVRLPKQYWRPHDAQDTAAATSADSELAFATYAASYAVGIVNAIAADGSMSDQSVDEANVKVLHAGDRLARSIALHAAHLRTLIESSAAPTFHQRAMVEASIDEWPGDSQWTLASPNIPDKSAYALLSLDGDGLINAEESGMKRESQFELCRRIDVLQSDILVAKKVLRAAESTVGGAHYREARTYYAQEILDASRDKIVEHVPDLEVSDRNSSSQQSSPVAAASLPSSTRKALRKPPPSPMKPPDAVSSTSTH